MHAGVTEKIRIIRRLDFTQRPRIVATYDEHAGVLQAIVARDCPGARGTLRAHIACSRDVARNPTLHRLVEAA
ncbi:FCD domain-containing protein [Cupriavidus basilensis]|uniref:FCD domain-containing protein n=1 Tax=Cupriavidus basilensis TaxID=68895 RepID=UPI0030CA3557